MDPWVVSWLLKWGGASIPTFPGTAWNEGSYVELCWKNLAIQNQQVGSCKPCGYCYSYSRYRYPCKTCKSLHRKICIATVIVIHANLSFPHSVSKHGSPNPEFPNFLGKNARFHRFHHSNLPNAKYMNPFMLFLPHSQMMPSRQYTVIIYSLRLFQNHSPGHLLPVHNLRGPHADLGQLLVVLATREPRGTVSSCISISSWFCSKIDKGKTWRLGQWTMTLQKCILLCQYILLSISTYHIQRGTNTAADVD